jgi:hypothetical protein
MGIDNVMGPDAHDGNSARRRDDIDNAHGWVAPKAPTFVDEINRLMVAAELGNDLHIWLRALELKKEVLTEKGHL